MATKTILATKREQRIKLRIEGSPVKYDGTVTETSPDGKCIKVVFDGPREDAVMYAWAGKMMSDMKDRNGDPTTNFQDVAKALYWEVL